MMPLKLHRSEIVALFKFRKGNPVNWPEFQTHLRSLDIEKFGQGIAETDSGARQQVLAASHANGQILYIPDGRRISIRGTELESIVSLAKEVRAILADMFRSPERLKSNLISYEVEVKQELEPQDATPFEIMEHVTPPGLFAPFEKALKIEKLNLFVFRPYYTSASVIGSIRETVPWYDLQFFPEIENPDRFWLNIVSRDNDQDVVIQRARALHAAAMRFLEEKEKEIGK